MNKYEEYDNVNDLEIALDLPKGSLRNIPIYARVPAVDAIKNVIEMEKESLFRPGLYYIVLADLKGNTEFNNKYGNDHTDIRVQWFHTAAIQSIGEINPTNYISFNKTIGDASLLIFSAIQDVINWSNNLNDVLDGMNQEYATAVHEDSLGVPINEDMIEEQIEDFKLDARRLVHLGEVQYTDDSDPLSLAVSQIFKAEKEFFEVKLGCTQTVAESIQPKISGLGYQLEENKKITIAGEDKETMTYYIVPS